VERKAVAVNKFRIVLNYNRIKMDEFTKLSWMSEWQIFSLDGGSDSESKGKVFESVKMQPLIEKSL
jgi:hypothetical protein